MKKIVAITLILIAAIVLYMWFGYANIYNRIRAGGLKETDNTYTYVFNEVSPNVIKYAALGDSLTAGVGVDNYNQSYPYIISEEMAEENKVILGDYSLLGARTEDLISKNLLSGAVKDSPDMVTVLIGVNDVRENISEKEFKKNYEYIVNELVDNTVAKIYLINIPFIGSDTLYLPPYNYYFKDKTFKFNNIIKSIAEEHNLDYIDIATPTKEIFRKDGIYYSVDSLHPSAEGYKFIAEIIYDGINP